MQEKGLLYSDSSAPDGDKILVIDNTPLTIDVAV